jgi:4-hydroxybenzoate polyprenyltransferase
VKRFIILLRAMRPGQWWMKNAFVLAPVMFALPERVAGGLAWSTVAVRGIAGFAVFCLISGATYLLNDLHDLEADRQHPTKRLRPLAAGELSEASARRAIVALFFVAALSALLLHWRFLVAVTAYFALNLAYSKGLKKVPWLDVGIIAAGFLLRIVAGGQAAQVPLSGWLILCTVLLAAFLGLGKRKHELSTSHTGHRAALAGYRSTHLTAALWVLALATSAAYAGYAVDPATARRFDTHALPWTIPFPLLGLSRFAVLLNRTDTAHSPTDRMLRDPLFLANLGLWAGLTFSCVYGWLP